MLFESNKIFVTKKMMYLQETDVVIKVCLYSIF